MVLGSYLPAYVFPPVRGARVPPKRGADADGVTLTSKGWRVTPETAATEFVTKNHTEHTRASTARCTAQGPVTLVDCLTYGLFLIHERPNRGSRSQTQRANRFRFRDEGGSGHRMRLGIGPAYGGRDTNLMLNKVGYPIGQPGCTAP